ncbi:MAG: HAD-IA family hydrolase [Candidatus Xenobia bacterium]
MIAAAILAWDGVLVETDPTRLETAEDRLAYLAAPLIPNAREIVLRLKPHCKVAAVSIAPPDLVEQLMQRHEIRVFFDAVVTGPQATLHRAAADRLEVAPENCIVVEGTEAGVRAARTSGMRCIAIPRRAREGDFTPANRIVNALADLTLEYLGAIDRPLRPAEHGSAAVLYARCHPASRADVLLARQLAAAGALARDRGWNVITSFQDEDAGNGWSQRPGLQGLINLVRRGDIQRVVVTEPSVLATGAFHQAEIINELAYHNVTLETVFRRSPMSGSSL